MTPAEKTLYELRKLKIRGAKDYIKSLNGFLKKTRVTHLSDLATTEMSLDQGFNYLFNLIRERVVKRKNRIIIIGNGGSAAMAIHMLMDYVNCGNIQTMDFTSPALITCMANDYGWKNVFAAPIKKLANEGDILFAISSSGCSKNILTACKTAKHKKCLVVTFSGFKSDNPLKQMGDLNFYVPSTHYGFVELAHEILLHCFLDLYVKRKMETAS